MQIYVAHTKTDFVEYFNKNLVELQQCEIFFERLNQ